MCEQFKRRNSPWIECKFRDMIAQLGLHSTLDVGHITNRTYNGGWNTERVRNSNGNHLVCQWFSVLFQMGAILSRHWKSEQNVHHFVWLLNVRDHRAIDITDHPKTEPSKIRTTKCKVQ